MIFPEKSSERVFAKGKNLKKDRKKERKKSTSLLLLYHFTFPSADIHEVIDSTARPDCHNCGREKPPDHVPRNEA